MNDREVNYADDQLIIEDRATTFIPAPGAIVPLQHPCMQEIFTQAATKEHVQKPFTQDAKYFVELEDATPVTPETLESLMLVVVKRGVGVDHAEKEGSPFLPFGDIRIFSPGMTWKEIHPPLSRYHQYLGTMMTGTRKQRLDHSFRRRTSERGRTERCRKIMQ